MPEAITKKYDSDTDENDYELTGPDAWVESGAFTVWMRKQPSGGLKVSVHITGAEGERAIHDVELRINPTCFVIKD